MNFNQLCTYDPNINSNNRVYEQQQYGGNSTGNEEEDDKDDVFNDYNEEFIEFKNNVKDWLALDDDISTLQKAIKERRDKKNLLTPSIIDFMNRFEINDLNTKNGKLKCSKTNYTKPLNKEYLMIKLGDYFRDLSKGEKVTQFLLTDRPKEEKIKLTRVNAKKQFSL
jgi:hypothetical protein